MFAIAFVTALAIYNSMLIGSTEEATQSTYNVIDRKGLNTPYFKDGEVITGQQLIDYIFYENRDMTVSVYYVSSSASNVQSYAVGVDPSTDVSCIALKSKYKMNILQSGTGLKTSNYVKASKV
jgi:hypothetical protein